MKAHVLVYLVRKISKTLEVQKSPIKVTKMKKGAKIRPKCPPKISGFKNSPKSDLGPKNVNVECEGSNLVKKSQVFVNPEENEANLSTFSVSACHFPDVFEEGGPNLEKGGSKTMDKSQILRSSKSEVKEKSRNIKVNLKPIGDNLNEGVGMKREGSDHYGGNFYPIKNRVISPSITANGDTKRYDQVTGANLGSLNFKSRAWKAKLGCHKVY